MTQEEIERLTVLLHDGYPCGQIGCRETGETFAALVAEVRRLRGLVEAAYLEGNRDRLPEGDAELADIQWARSDAREALEGA